MTETEALVYGLKELDAESGSYRLAMAYYLGQVGEHFASNVTRRRVGTSGDAYRVNAARCPIDALVDRLTLSAVTAVRVDGTPYPEAQTALTARVWTPNQLDRQIPLLIRDTSIYGDGYLYLWKGDDDSPRPVTVAYNSPLSVRVIYSPADITVPVYAVKRWESPDGTESANLITLDEVIRYVLDKDHGGKWDDPSGWLEVGRTPHDFPGRLPVEHFANWMPYGRPEHRDAYGPQNAISKLAPTMVDSAESAGYPSRYALAAADSAVRGDRPDGLDYDDDDPQDMTSTSSTKSSLNVGPGEVALLEGVQQAGQWAAASSTTFTDGANWFIRAMAQTTNTPTHLLDPSGSVPSGESRRIADAPLESKVKLRRGVYGSGLSSTLSTSLAALGFTDARVHVKWSPSPVSDDSLTWQVAEAKIRCGVPREIALAETGLYDPEVIAGWKLSGTANDGSA